MDGSGRSRLNAQARREGANMTGRTADGRVGDRASGSRGLAWPNYASTFTPGAAGDGILITERGCFVRALAHCERFPERQRWTLTPATSESPRSILSDRGSRTMSNTDSEIVRGSTATRG